MSGRQMHGIVGALHGWVIERKLNYHVFFSRATFCQMPKTERRQFGAGKRDEDNKMFDFSNIIFYIFDRRNSKIS
jgi:hypothetical protein